MSVDYDTLSGKMADELGSKELSDYDVHLKKIIETFLFSAGEPVPINEIFRVNNEIPMEKVLELILRLKLEYEGYNGALKIQIIRLKDDILVGFSLNHDIIGDPRIKYFNPGESLKRSELEVLSLIAYYQPIDREDLIELLGKKCLKIVNRLCNLGFIHETPSEIPIVEKDDEVRTFQTVSYQTTSLFSQMLGLPDDKEKIREYLESLL